MGQTPLGRRPDDARLLGAFVAQERQRRGLTRAELAAMIRKAAGPGNLTNGRAVERWELQGQIPQPATLRALAAVLEVSVDRLVALAHQQPTASPMPTNGADEERLTFASAHPHAIDQRSLDDLAQLTHLYARQAQAMAPGVLLAAVAGLMHRLRELLAGSHPEATRRRLQALYAENATMAGRLAFWNDDRGQAEQVLRLAGDLAGEAGERHLLAVVLAFRADLYSTVSYIGTVPNNTNVALALFEEAAALDAPNTPPFLRSWVYGCRAEEYATLRRGLESDRDMERAHTAQAAAGPVLGADQVLDISTMDIAAAAAGLSGFEGACALALGRAREAREAFEAGLREQSSIGRLSGLAAAAALEGDVEEAAELLTRGLEESIIRQLPTRRRRVEGVRAAFLSSAVDHPAVQRFDERLRAAIG